MVNCADEIKRAVPARELFEHYGFEINRAGFCHSPFAANDKTPSLKIYECDRGWHDFSSGKGGDIIAFVQEYFRLSFPEACAKINSDFNLGLPIGKKLSLRQQRDAERAAKERKAKREAERAHYQSLKDDWYQWMECWETLDGYLRDLAPTTPDEEINPLYARAAKNIAYAGYMLDEAEMRLRKHELERSGNN